MINFSYKSLISQMSMLLFMRLPNQVHQFRVIRRMFQSIISNLLVFVLTVLVKKKQKKVQIELFFSLCVICLHLCLTNSV